MLRLRLREGGVTTRIVCPKNYVKPKVGHSKALPTLPYLPRPPVSWVPKQLLASASIVIDWCMVGTERMPVEAVLCGAVLLTSACRKGGGADPRDFPLPAQNVLQL